MSRVEENFFGRWRRNFLVFGGNKIGECRYTGKVTGDILEHVEGGKSFECSCTEYLLGPA